MSAIGAGSAILLSEPPLHNPHLWFVLTDPYGDPPKLIAVMMRTRTKFTDDTVVLVSGEHPFVRHDSAVHYSTAQIFSVKSLMKAMRDGRCHVRESVEVALLGRLQQGLLTSRLLRASFSRALAIIGVSFLLYVRLITCM